MIEEHLKSSDLIPLHDAKLAQEAIIQEYSFDKHYDSVVYNGDRYKNGYQSGVTTGVI